MTEAMFDKISVAKASDQSASVYGSNHACNNGWLPLTVQDPAEDISQILTNLLIRFKEILHLEIGSSRLDDLWLLDAS